MTDQLKTCLPCDGIQVITPRPVYNRPGLDALKYRIGTQSSFFESLLARISTLTSEELAELSLSVNQRVQQRRNRKAKSPSKTEHPLRDWLTTREKNDPAIAMLDAWSVVADVLTFYQERIANEGFLRTAQERRSIQELARLTGYRLRPGVSSTVYLAFEVEDTNTTIPFGNAAPTTQSSTPILIPKGTAVKSTPAPGTKEEPQTFETSRGLIARVNWNEIRPRMSRPQRIDSGTVHDLEKLYFKGNGLRLSRNDYLCVVYDPAQEPVLKRIVFVDDDQKNQRTTVTLQLDQLAPQKLLEEIQKAITEFGNLQSPPQAETTRQMINQHFADVISDPKKRGSLLQVDIEFQKLVCVRLSATGDIGKLADEFSKRLKNLVGTDELGTPCLRRLLNLDAAATAFAQNLTNDINALKSEDDRLTQVDTLLNSMTTPTIPTVLATLEQQVRELVFPGTSVSYWATSPEIVAATDKPFTSLEAVANGITSTPLEAKVTVLRGSTPTFTLSDPDFDWTSPKVTPKASPQNSPTSVSLLRAIKNLTAGDSIDRDLLLELQVAGSPVAIVVQRTGTPQFHLKVEKSMVLQNVQSPAPSVPPSLNISVETDLSTPAKATYAARVTLKRLDSSTDVGTLSLPGTSNFKVTGSGPSFTILQEMMPQDVSFSTFSSMLDSLTYQAPTTPGVVAAVIEVFDDQSQLNAAHCIASGTIDLICCVPAEGEERAIVRGLVSLHADAAVPGSTVTTVKKNFQSKLWSAAAQAANRAIHTSPDGLVSKVNTTSLSTTAKAAKAAAEQIPISDNELWKKRLREFRDKMEGRVVAAKTDVEGILTVARQSLQAGQSPGSVRRLAEGDTHLDALLNATDTEINRIQQPASSGNSFEVLVSLVDSIIQFDDALHTTSNDLLKRAADLQTKLTNLRQSIMSAMTSRRVTFLGDAIGSIKRSDAAFQATSGVPAEEVEIVESVKGWLKAMIDEFTLRQNDLTPRAPSVNVCCNTTPCYQLDCFRNLIEAQIDHTASPAPANTQPEKNLKAALAVCTDFRRSSLKTILDELGSLLRRIQPLRFDREATKPTFDTLQKAINTLEELRRASESARQTLVTDLLTLFTSTSDLLAQLTSTLDSSRQAFLYDILRSSRIGAPVTEPKVFAFRTQANLFGWNASDGSALAAAITANLKTKVPCIKAETGTSHPNTDEAEKSVNETLGTSLASLTPTPDDTADLQRMFIDGDFQLTGPGSVIGVRLPGVVGRDEPKVFFVENSRTRPRTAYGVKGNASELRLTNVWWPANRNQATQSEFADVIRNTRVLCDAEMLSLADAPDTDGLEPSVQIECDALLEGLSSSKPVIISGHPIIPSGQSATLVSESFTITDVDHSIEPTLFGDAFRTTIRLDRKPSYSFKRDSVRIYANVVEATHGETQREVLGSGDGAKEFQKFLLKRPEMSQIVTPNERGIQSTLVVKVNDVEWDEEESLREATEQQEAFVSQTNDAQQMSVVFGDGVNGARLPTGLENLRAEYRTGLGRKGNVAGGQINQLLGAPLGVKKVNNPLAAKGGADPESRELAREHAPLAVTAMDRLVSVRDYEDFARTYAGIGKASASMIQGTVHVTIAGLDPEPLDADNPIFSNLMHAFGIFGDPSQSFQLHPREASLLIIVAKIKIDRRYEWQHVQPKIRAALLALFHYDRRDLGQDALLSDAIAIMQSIEGVSYVDVDRFDAVRQQDVSTLASRLGSIQRRPRVHVNLARFTSDARERAALGRDEITETVPTAPAANPGDSANNKPADIPKLRPAELCYLTPDIPDTLILELIP